MNAIGFKYSQSKKSRNPIGGGVSQALSSENHDAAVAYGISFDATKGFPIVKDTAQTQISGNCPGFRTGVATIGFKAGQSKDGVKCYDPYNNTESEATPTIRSNAGVSTAGPLAYGADLSQMRYIVRRLTPTECERLMGLPDDYCIPTGLRRFFDADGEPSPALVAEFQRIHDTFGAIMAEYEHAKPPKPKTAAQVQKWLAKITDPATCPDSPRYKGCGNGWATNQPRWILMRLLHFTEQESTQTQTTQTTKEKENT